MDEHLPSQAAASRLVAGEAGALLDVLFWTSVRAALIAGGLWVAGERKGLVLKSYAGALAVEVFVLGWAWKHKAKP